MVKQLGTLATLLMAMAAGLAAQEPAALRSFAALRDQVSQAQTMRGVIEIRAEWPPAASVAQGIRSTPTIGRIVSLRARTGTMRRERRPELSADRLVVVVLDQHGAELDWRLVVNPSVVRAEWAGADGQFVAGTAPAIASELWLTIPDLPGAASLRIYEPRAGDAGFTLALAAELALVAR